MHDRQMTSPFAPLVMQMLRQGHSIRFTAAGRSMRPTIHDGDSLVVEPVNPALLRRGDVVLAEYDGSMRAHRIIEIPRGSASLFVMQGDALPSPDAPLEARQILGRIVEVERNGKCRPVGGVIVRGRIRLRRSLAAQHRKLPDRLQKATIHMKHLIQGLPTTIAMSANTSRGNRGVGV